ALVVPRSLPTIIALAASLVGAQVASAEGETTTPMIGAAVVGAEADRTPTEHADLAGVALDLAWWHGRFGLAAEGSGRWSVDGDNARALVAGASARFQLFERILPSLMEPRDVELAFELQAIAEHTWWNDTVSQVEPTAYGVGLAARLRGTGDPDGSALLAE